MSKRAEMRAAADAMHYALPRLLGPRVQCTMCAIRRPKFRPCMPHTARRAPHSARRRPRPRRHHITPAYGVRRVGSFCSAGHGDPCVVALLALLRGDPGERLNGLRHASTPIPAQWTQTSSVVISAPPMSCSPRSDSAPQLGSSRRARELAVGVSLREPSRVWRLDRVRSPSQRIILRHGHSGRPAPARHCLLLPPRLHSWPRIDTSFGQLHVLHARTLDSRLQTPAPWIKPWPAFAGPLLSCRALRKSLARNVIIQTRGHRRPHHLMFLCSYPMDKATRDATVASWDAAAGNGPPTLIRSRRSVERVSTVGPRSRPPCNHR